jgi:hypothetical protein
MQNWLRLNADIPVPEIGRGGGGRREKGHWLPTFSQMRVTVTRRPSATNRRGEIINTSSRQESCVEEIGGISGFLFTFILAPPLPPP